MKSECEVVDATSVGGNPRRSGRPRESNQGLVVATPGFPLMVVSLPLPDRIA
jgi:hypothetical protein